MACGCGLIFRGVGCKKIRQVSRPAVFRLIRAGAGKDKGYVRVKCVITLPGRPAGLGESHLSWEALSTRCGNLGGSFHSTFCGLSSCGTAFRCLALHRPGLAPAGDLLSCCTTRKKAKKRTPLPRPLRGFPPSGNAVRGLRKLALRAQTCEALFPPVITSSRHVRGDRKCR